MTLTSLGGKKSLLVAIATLTLLVVLLTVTLLVIVLTRNEIVPDPQLPVRSEDGYDLWLRYRTIDKSLIDQYTPHVRSIVTPPSISPIIQAAVDELRSAFFGLLNFDIPIDETVTQGSIVIGTPSNSDVIRQLNLSLDYLGMEGYLIRQTSLDGRTFIVITGNTDQGILYGAFNFLRLLQTETGLDSVDISSTPKVKLRIMNHWDNLDRTVEHGFAGHSLWDWWRLPDLVDPRYTDYARAQASIGINGVVINNVNSKPDILTASWISKAAALADVFRPYGIKVYLSPRFSTPLELRDTGTADPLNQAVIDWWHARTNDIYAVIPDFDGFLVKASSEGQPGPGDYGRSHAEGANMLAEALRPHGGIVMWRAFVYSEENPDDRHKQAYADFKPLDGQFASNVIVQVKNGAIDFQPREPFHPLFGAMPETHMSIEVQLTKEYLGFATHLAYLGSMWEEVLAADTFVKGNGSTLYEQTSVDVAGWFANVMETAGIKSSCRNSPLPDTANRLTTNSQIPNYQYKNNNSNSSSSTLSKPQSQPILLPPSSSPPIHKPQPYQNPTTKNYYTNHDSQHIQQQQQQNQLNQLKQQEMNGTPPPLPKKQFYSDRNGYMRDETDIVSEMNQMYMNSPFVQRRCEPPEANYGSSPKMEAIYNNIAQNRNYKYLPGSPYLQRKFSQPQDGFWNLQHPPDDGGSKSATTSPYARKRFQTTIPVADQSQYTHLQGNTSPIVLQRFYHQQSQHRDKSERNRPKIDSTNPFLSHIPKYQFEPSSSPSSYESSNDYKTFNPNASNNYTTSSSSNQFNSSNSNIPTYQPQSSQNSPKNPFIFSNSNNRKISSSPQSVYNERGGGSNSGYGNQNVYSNNLYGRTMSKSEHKSNVEKSAMNGKHNTGTREDQGWFNSFAGVFKRRFASYVKLNLTAGDKQQEKDSSSFNDKRSSANSTNYGSSGSQLPVSSMIYPPSPHVLSIDRRHRSPDPPPRLNRGQSPLLLRRNLLEYGQASGSPILQRRLTSSPPLPPPRRSSESMPGSPQNFRTKIHYTPEPQRRIYRSIDQ